MNSSQSNRFFSNMISRAIKMTINQRITRVDLNESLRSPFSPPASFST